MKKIKFSEAKLLIEEGDILLFRGKGMASWFIRKASHGLYTHVGIASFSNGNKETSILECVEFREGSFIASLFNKNAGGGGRAVNLKLQVDAFPGQIDVYRPVPYFASWLYNEDKKDVLLSRRKFNGKLVTRTMRQMTGLPYGWKRIIWMAKRNLAVIRVFYGEEDLVSDTFKEIIYPVCSTAIAYSFSKNGYDLIPNRSDEFTQPSNIANSSRLSYLFTLTNDAV